MPELPICPIQSEEHAALLLDYCARRLDAGQMAELDAHFAVCAQCRQFRDQQALLWNALDEWNSAPISAGFDRSLRLDIESFERQPVWVRWVDWFYGISLKPAVPVFGLLTLLFFFSLPPRHEESPAPAVQTTEAEQFESDLEDLDLLQQLPL